MKKSQKLKFIIGISALLLLSKAFDNKLINRNYVVKTKKLSKDSTVRLVLITDLHSTVHGKDQRNIRNRIQNKKPDLIVLSGDIADEVFPIEGTELFLKAIKSIAPIYYVTGNHEIRSGQQEEMKRLFKSYGVRVLENNVEEIVRNGVKLIIAGVDDPDIILDEKLESNWKDEISKAFANVDQRKGYKLLLSHRPEYVMFYNTLDFDMVLSGHAHGGQVRIPFVMNGLFAPNQGLFPRYAGGLYKHTHFVHIISRGTSFYLKHPRIFNRPEVVVIDIEGEVVKES